MGFPKKVIPTSLKREINRHGNSTFAEVLIGKTLRYPLDRELYVIAKRKAVEVYSSHNSQYLGNVYFTGERFYPSGNLKKNLYVELSYRHRISLMDSLMTYLSHREVKSYVVR